MRRPEIGKLVEKIFMRPDLISRYLPVRQHREKSIYNIVRECPTIVRKARRSARVIGKNVWQQLFGYADRLGWRVAARVFQLMREDANKSIIFGRLPIQVRYSLFSRQENRLQRSPAAICLKPALRGMVQCTSP